MVKNNKTTTKSSKSVSGGQDKKPATKPVKKSTKAKQNYTYAVGRRKTASARVRLYAKKSVPGSDSNLIVNGVKFEKYFPSESQKAIYMKPFVVTETKGKFSVSAKVVGSGLSGQLGAVVHGIARTISIYDTEKYRSALKKAGLLTRDPRKRERRKVGTGGKARRKKQSPKR